MTPPWLCRYSSGVRLFILKPADQSAGVGAATVAARIIHVDPSAAYKGQRRRSEAFNEPVMKITSNSNAMIGAVAITGFVAMPTAQAMTAMIIQRLLADWAARITA